MHFLISRPLGQLNRGIEFCDTIFNHMIDQQLYHYLIIVSLLASPIKKYLFGIDTPGCGSYLCIAGRQKHAFDNH